MSDKFWDEEIEICCVLKNKTDYIKVTKCKKNGRMFYSFKVFYKDDDDQLKPAKGSPFVVSKDNFDEITKAINKA